MEDHPSSPMNSGTGLGGFGTDSSAGLGGSGTGSSTSLGGSGTGSISALGGSGALGGSRTGSDSPRLGCCGACPLFISSSRPYAPPRFPFFGTPDQHPSTGGSTPQSTGSTLQSIGSTLQSTGTMSTGSISQTLGGQLPVKIHYYKQLRRAEKEKDKLVVRQRELEKDGEGVVKGFLGNLLSFMGLITPYLIFYNLEKVPCQDSFAFSAVLCGLLLAASASCAFISFHNLSRLSHNSKDFKDTVDEVIKSVDTLLKLQPPSSSTPEIPLGSDNDSSPGSLFSVGYFTYHSGTTNTKFAKISYADFMRRAASTKKSLDGLGVEEFRSHCKWGFIFSLVTGIFCFLAIPAVAYILFCWKRSPSTSDLVLAS